MSNPRRVIAYIDGYNLYYGMKSAGFSRFLWVDLQALVAQFLLAGQRLEATKYFTSRVSQPPESVARQSAYIDVNRDRGAHIIEGRHGGDTLMCQCGRAYAMPGEKMTDVNIALSVVRDAHLGLFDTAFLITGDSDQVPTIRMVREVFPALRVVALFPPNRVSSALRKAAHVALSINENHLRHSQLPNPARLSTGISIFKPTKWT